MNALWPRVLRSAYRREPIVSFVVTVGIVDAVIGGVSSSVSLLSFGTFQRWGNLGFAVVDVAKV